MRRLLSLTAAGAMAFALAVPAVAQDAPSYADVQSLTFAPGHADAFLEQVKIVRDAAEEIGLDAQFRWDVYRWDDQITFVSWPESLDFLANETDMMEAFAGSAAADRVMGAMMAAGDLMMLEADRWVSMARTDLGYTPANPAITPGGHGGLYVIEQWVKGAGHVEAFNESAQGFMAMLEEMGGPYPVIVQQDITGDGGVSFIVPFDNLGNFYGANSIEARLAADPAMAERWAAHVSAHNAHITRVESRIVNYLPQYSYRPDLAETSTGGN